jgi:hypothetical protein
MRQPDIPTAAMHGRRELWRRRRLPDHDVRRPPVRLLQPVHVFRRQQMREWQLRGETLRRSRRCALPYWFRLQPERPDRVEHRVHPGALHFGIGLRSRVRLRNQRARQGVRASTVHRRRRLRVRLLRQHILRSDVGLLLSDHRDALRLRVARRRARLSARTRCHRSVRQIH